MSGKVDLTKVKTGSSSFILIGKYIRKIGRDGTDYSFELDKKAKTGNVFSKAKFIVDCGNNNEVYAEMFGMCHEGKNHKFECPTKVFDADGKFVEEDWNNKIEVHWDDRNNDLITKQVGTSYFTKVGIEKDIEGNTVTKYFISPYDAVQYMYDNLQDGSIVRLNGKLSYSIYEGELQVQKQVTSIYLSNVEEKDYKAEFIQTILVDKNSIQKTDIKNKKIVIDSRVLAWHKELKTNYPYNVKLEMRFDNEESQAMMERTSKVLFAPKKDIDEITIIGRFVESIPLVNIEDVEMSPAIKELMKAGLFTAQTVKEKAIGREKKTRTMVFTQPDMINVDKDGVTTTDINRTFGKYKEEDLYVEGSEQTEKSEETLKQAEDVEIRNNLFN